MRTRDYVSLGCLIVAGFGLYMLNPWYAVVWTGIVGSWYSEGLL